MRLLSKRWALLAAALAVAWVTSGTRYPRLARSGSEMLFAWTATEKDAPHVLTARARIR